jgi:hypothetical protein
MRANKMDVAVELEQMPGGRWVGYIMFSDYDNLKLFQKFYSRLQFERVLKQNLYRLDEDSVAKAKAWLAEKGGCLPYNSTVPKPAPLLDEEAGTAYIELLDRLVNGRERERQEGQGVGFPLPALAENE